jgi:hypothetical protein
MVARGKEKGRRLALSRQIRVDREVYEELLQRVAQLQTRAGRRRPMSFNDVLRELLLSSDADGRGIERR